ncbi:MAG: hypothetical protein IPL94_03870 [Tetrasphaera sp.]|jgi:hypothetical protein|nr:hypothetical protein [Tetrasphaera sp.]
MSTSVWPAPSSARPDPGAVPASASEPENHSRIIEFVLAIGLTVPLTVPLLNLPSPEVAGLLLVLYGWFLPTDIGQERPRWFPVLLVLLWVELAVSAVLNGVDGTRRLGHLAIFILLALMISSGRLHRLSLLRGMALGLFFAAITAIVARFLGIEGAYGERLTGLFSDPNVAGFHLVVFGALVMTGARSGFRRWLGAAALLIAIGLTLSRTSLIATILGLVWLLLYKRVPGRWALALLAASFPALMAYAESFRYWGPFSERTGSDALRDRILLAEEQLLPISPWYGRGPGTAYVQVDGSNFFFHSSYLGLLNEAGRIGFVIFLVGVVALLFRLVGMPTELRQPWYEAAIVAFLLCAFNLGEVLLEIPTAVTLGMAMRHLLRPRELSQFEADHNPGHVL